MNVDRKDILNVAGISLVMILSLVVCDILIRIWETTNLQYDKWKIRLWSSSDHELLCKSFFNFFSENNDPFVIVMSKLFICFISDSCKILLLILFYISVTFFIAFLEDMHLMITFYIGTLVGTWALPNNVNKLRINMKWMWR